MFLKLFIEYIGLFKNQQDFPTWIGWIEFLSPYKYAFEALCRNEYDGLYFNPDPVKILGMIKIVLKLFLMMFIEKNRIFARNVELHLCFARVFSRISNYVLSLFKELDEEIAINFISRFILN